MQIEKRTSFEERKILIGMIVDAKVLSRICANWKGGMFRSRWSNLVGQWCIDFFKKYEKPPMNHIEGMFRSWAEKGKDTEIIQLVESFLQSLSGEYALLKKQSNSDYLIDFAGKYFNRVALERIVEEIQGDLDLGQEEKAISRITQYNRIELGVGSGLDLFQNRDSIREAFEDRVEPLIRFRGDLGLFYGNSLEREGFISFMAPEKRGKTWCLIDIAVRAVLQRRKVAFFAAGDMSQNQMIRRFMVRISGHPFRKGIIQYPISISKSPEQKIASVQFVQKEFKEDLNWQLAYERCQNFLKKAKTNESLLKLSCHPNSTLSVFQIKNMLMEWERDGWVADVVVIDYADILNMSCFSVDNQRDRINETWKQLRSLSQIFHCLVLTATQTNALSYQAKTMNRTHFSEDKRKMAHITGAIGINSTPREKEKGIYRFNWIVRREEDYRESHCIYTASCLSVGNPAVCSCFGEEEEIEEKDDEKEDE